MLPAPLVEAWVVVPAVDVAGRVGVLVAWAPSEADGLLVGVVALPGSANAAAKGVGDARQA